MFDVKASNFQVSSFCFTLWKSVIVVVVVEAAVFTQHFSCTDALVVLIESNEGPPPPNAQTVFFDPAVDHQTAAELLANPTKATDNPLPPINRANGHEEL